MSQSTERYGGLVETGWERVTSASADQAAPTLALHGSRAPGQWLVAVILGGGTTSVVLQVWRWVSGVGLTGTWVKDSRTSVTTAVSMIPLIVVEGNGDLMAFQLLTFAGVATSPTVVAKRQVVR